LINLKIIALENISISGLDGIVIDQGEEYELLPDFNFFEILNETSQLQEYIDSNKIKVVSNNIYVNDLRNFVISSFISLSPYVETSDNFQINVGEEKVITINGGNFDFYTKVFLQEGLIVNSVDVVNDKKINISVTGSFPTPVRNIIVHRGVSFHFGNTPTYEVVANV